MKVGGAEAVGWADRGVGGVGLRLARLLGAGLWPHEPTPTGFAGQVTWTSPPSAICAHQINR